jgi:hypothetical protein
LMIVTTRSSSTTSRERDEEEKRVFWETRNIGPVVLRHERTIHQLEPFSAHKFESRPQLAEYSYTPASCSVF